MDSISHSAPARRGRPCEVIPAGSPFGRYTIVSGPHAKPDKPTNRTFYLCRCKCGTEKLVDRGNLTRGSIVSCGCHRRDRLTVHGDGTTRLGNIRTLMVQRCTNPKRLEFQHYGGRGITVCQEWSDSYETFRDWALANGYRDGLTIERVDVNGNYEPSNCTWIPLGDQSKNRRNNVRYTAFGETKCVTEWARDSRCAVTLKSLRRRLKQWDFVSALTAPAMPPTERNRHRQY